MDHNQRAQAHHELGPFQFFTLILSVYVLGALFVESAFDLSDDLLRLLRVIDSMVCMVFLTDFGLRFYKAPRKLQFMKWGWIDLLSSIPMLDALRYGRFVHLFRFMRMLRAIRSSKVILAYLFHNRREGTFSIVASISVLLVIFGAIGILQFERGIAESNIHSAGDALWWAFVTITTVGYGDYYPVTTAGRMLAAVLMTAGVGLFGTFTGFVATWFMTEEDNQTNHDLVAQHQQIKTELQQIKALLLELQNTQHQSK
ncbi:ion transporter [Vibrio gallicus]|uniref:ion transporter n=1 Tax=Vibrio gallicus TaxID=190897 RepID=UPI0021C2AB9F|nr:ion transporter [Vibrio gallicus]